MKKFSKVIVWGYPLNTHTHSFIHYCFTKTFKHLGYETHWFDDSSDVSGMNFDGALFITASDQEKNIPIIKGAHYVLHNVDSRRYHEAGCKLLFIQTIAKDIVGQDKLKVYSRHTMLKYFDDVNCLYMPWATDLLPHEIDLNTATNQTTDKRCVWIGTYGGDDSEYQNHTEVKPFFDACEKNGIKIHRIDPWAKPVTFEENKELVRNSYLSPALQGIWQVKNEYIPCRIFKNISYGHLGITNSPIVNEIFDNQLIFSRDTDALFYQSVEEKNKPDCVEKIKFLMNEVKEKHTYINRIETILECLPD
jgi:hypothetical protein